MAKRLRTRDWAGVDYYRELGVDPAAPRTEVDEAYRREAKAWHPDRNPDVEAEDRFKRLTAAYEVLRDPASRQAYDDFRTRVTEGRLYDAPWGSSPGPRPEPRPSSTGWVPPPPAPARRRRAWRIPDHVRVALGIGMLVAGIAAVAWALLGELPSNSAGDTRVAVQITLGIMAAKLLGCGLVVIRYPQLRARWHHPPA
jgi:hypothetical protein